MPDKTSRTRQPKGVPTGGEFATEAKGENPDLSSLESPAAMAYGENGIVAWGITPREMDNVLSGLSPLELGDILSETGAARREGLELVVGPRLVGLLRGNGLLRFRNSGELRVHAERFNARLQDLWVHPGWVQDGHTPHPSGGYVECRRSMNEKRLEFQTYLDVDGKLHREDGPAKRITSAEGTHVEAWMRHGLYERSGGLPAFVDSSHDLTTMMWYRDGKVIARIEGLEPGENLSQLRFPD